MTEPALLPEDILTRDGKRWVHRVRQSSLGDFFHMCPEKLRVQHVGIVPRTTPGEAAVGTGLHAAIEHCCLALKAGTQFDSEQALDIGFAAYDAEAQTEGFRDLRKGDPYLLIHQAFVKWYNQALPTLGPIREVEWHFEDFVLHEDDKRVVLTSGTVDMIADRMYDWKTAGRTWKFDAWEKKRWGVQPSTYLPPWEKHSGERLTFGWWVFVHGKDEAEFYKTERTAEQDAWFKEHVVSYAEQAEALQLGALTHWIKNDAGWWCHSDWCSNWSRCKGRNGLTFA